MKGVTQGHGHCKVGAMGALVISTANENSSLNCPKAGLSSRKYKSERRQLAWRIPLGDFSNSSLHLWSKRSFPSLRGTQEMLRAAHSSSTTRFNCGRNLIIFSDDYSFVNVKWQKISSEICKDLEMASFLLILFLVCFFFFLSISFRKHSN